jgi:hypothetical protein
MKRTQESLQVAKDNSANTPRRLAGENGTLWGGLPEAAVRVATARQHHTVRNILGLDLEIFR